MPSVCKFRCTREKYIGMGGRGYIGCAATTCAPHLEQK